MSRSERSVPATRDHDPPPLSERPAVMQLLFGVIILAGVVCILLGQLVGGTAGGILLGIGVGLLPTGGVSILQAHYVDKLSQRATLTAIRDQVRVSFEDHERLLRECAALGVEGVCRTRPEALRRFAPHIAEEIRRAERGQPARLWFICTSMRGFIYPAEGGFDPKGLIGDAATLPTLELRVVLLHPQWALVRDHQERHERPIIAGETEDSVRLLQEECNVPEEAIRFASGGPTVFAIATSEHMLLNPYPYGEEAHRGFTLLVGEAGRPAEGRDQGGIYGQYLRTHFERIWQRATGLDQPPSMPYQPAAGAAKVRVSKDQEVDNELLRAEIERQPPSRADLLEFSTQSVRPVIRALARGANELRILVKHPDSVGPAQRTRIIDGLTQLERLLRGYRGDVKIRCYRQWVSLRGRKLDDSLINIGWYTPELDEHGQATATEVVGDTNPLVTSALQTEEGQHLQRMFDEVFEGLWRSAEHDDAREVLGRYRDAG